MARGGFSVELAAAALADAAVTSDKAAAMKHGVSRRSIENWRGRLSCDPELARLLAQKLASLEQHWAAQVPETIRRALAFLDRACEALDPTDARAVLAVVGALRVLIECRLTLDLLEARQSTPSLIDNPTRPPVLDGDRRSHYNPHI